MPWHFAFALPNLKLSVPIEARYIALVPHDDARLTKLKDEEPRLKAFLSRFTDAHGARVRPSVVLSNKPSPASARTADALAGFRDLIAASVVLKGRSIHLTNPNRMGRPLFSNMFDPYPWRPTDNYEFLILQSPAQTAVHEIKKFRALTVPEIPIQEVGEAEIDRPLLDCLLTEWMLHFKTAKPSMKSVALFRSLNVASQAMRMPGATGITMHDLGRALMLWGSAFEILAHPGGESGVYRDHVYALLERVTWVTKFCQRRAYRCTDKAKHVAACWLYDQLFKVRNRFTHGNPVSIKHLRLPRARGQLWMQAAPLYRLALGAYLDIVFKPASITSGEENYRRQFLVQWEQGNAEKGIRTAKPRSVSRGRRMEVYLRPSRRPRQSNSRPASRR